MRNKRAQTTQKLGDVLPGRSANVRSSYQTEWVIRRLIP
jgi:hypothetical protein